MKRIATIVVTDYVDQTTTLWRVEFEGELVREGADLKITEIVDLQIATAKQ